MMIPINIDPHSGLPIYRQVVDQVKYTVANGALRLGDQLPSIRELSRFLSVNPTTIVKAYGELAHEGIIENVHGKGAFVAKRRKRMSQARKRAVLRDAVRKLIVEADRLGAELAEVAKMLEDEICIASMEDEDD